MCISETSFFYLVSLKTLDLAYNPLACTCDMVWFKHWLYHKELELVDYSSERSYTCSSPHDVKNLSLRKFSLSPVDCSSKMASYLVIGVPVTLTLLCALASFVYRNWWYLRYYKRQRKNNREIHRQQRHTLLDAEAFQYDAYVCYHSSSRRWVIDLLVPELEDNAGFEVVTETGFLAVQSWTML